MSAFTPIKLRAQKKRKADPIVHDLDQRVQLLGRKLSTKHGIHIELDIHELFERDEVDEFRDLGIIGGAPSQRDENGFTPAQKKWLKAYKLFRHYAKTMSDETARDRVADELKIKNRETFYKVTKHGREDVNQILRFEKLIP